MAVHNQLYEIQETRRKRIREEEERERAERRKNENSNEPYTRETLVMTPTPDRELYISQGKLVTTDLKLKVLEKNIGYFIR